MPTIKPVSLIVPVLLIVLGICAVGFAMYYRRRGIAFRNRYYVALLIALIALSLASVFSIVSCAA